MNISIAKIASTQEELFTSNKKRFIELSYLTILGREADKDSLDNFLQQFRQNLNPEQFLTILRSSEEAKNRWQNNINYSQLSNENYDKMKNSLTIEDLIAISKNIQ